MFPKNEISKLKKKLYNKKLTAQPKRKKLESSTEVSNQNLLIFNNFLLFILLDSCALKMCLLSKAKTKKKLQKIKTFFVIYLKVAKLILLQKKKLIFSGERQ